MLHLSSSLLCLLYKERRCGQLSKPVAHNTCSFLDSKDEVKQPITLPELTKQLLKAKEKLAEFPDNLKVSFQKRHCGSGKRQSFCKGSLLIESLSYRK